MPQRFAQFFPLVFPFFWLAIVTSLSAMSGWMALWKAFPSPRIVEGRRFQFVSGAMGYKSLPVSYGNCLFVTVGDAGFRLALFFLFRPLSPPLFIPWREVVSVDARRWWFFTNATIRLRGRTKIIQLRGSAGRSVIETWARVGHPDR